jgi:hypothetical protein
MIDYPIGVIPEARDCLIQRFGLSDTHYIDWAVTVTDPSRLQEFIDGYKSFTWTVDEKYALMIIIVASYEEALKECTANEPTWNEIRSLLINDLNIHIDTIINWSLKDEDFSPEEIDENGYLITRRMIEVYESCNIQAIAGKDRWD